MEPRSFDDIFRESPTGLDADAIRQAWHALGPAYDVEQRRPPVPVWARRPFTDSGRAAWDTVRRDIPSGSASTPFCIYIHIPFCAHHCGFCDCYSFALRSHREEHVQRYLAALLCEIDAWAKIPFLRDRPVSTVHLGGGTPTLLDHDRLAQLTTRLRQSFLISPETEWALESTSSALAGDRLSLLAELGFVRLHVGVQSLEDNVRTAISRVEPANEVMEKIEAASAMGWIVSVDLIAGLPGQSMGGIIRDIRALAGAGVEGFSVYELQISSRNRAFAERNGLRDRTRQGSYFLMQAAIQELERQRYEPTLFNNWARGRDANLYFTFPERGEDCLALGAIADGIFGDYHYRHGEYSDYLSSTDASCPGLQGGLRRNAIENRLFPLETALLSARFSSGQFSSILGGQAAQRLFDRWSRAGLITLEPGGNARLTANGSWFAGNMMSELSAAV